MYLAQVAKQFATEVNLSYVETSLKMLELGLPLEKVKDIMPKSSIDFNNCAVKRATSLAEYYATVYPNLIEEFLFEYGFNYD